MTVRKLRPQLALHVESGVTLGSAGREEMELTSGEHVLTLPVERGERQMRFYLPTEPRWDDNGERLPPEIADNLQSIITEIALFWDREPSFRSIFR
ncbi:hypothetical protein ACTOB_002110 [Actinoplanes oblitus]|uniref:Uncharacterized protein n=1 Tax=Actinoplanes oblitus TaxID=3040509 RepID=A0ABY8WKW0_9ACTN|nr:hypothetical protein [Actinoplanes oblitus]WIM98509.1 hypothetical protein ACTOB_002110 [Actinoplanes oblitus]